MVEYFRPRGRSCSLFHRPYDCIIYDEWVARVDSLGLTLVDCLMWLTGLRHDVVLEVGLPAL